MLLLGASLKVIWSVLNTLQFIVLFNEIKANLIADCVLVLSILRKLAFLEFKDLKKLLKEWLGLDEGGDDVCNKSSFID